MARIAPSTGPMHGVQPTATSAPRARVRVPPIGEGAVPTRFGTRSRTGPNRPVMSSPRPMTMTPASWRTIGSRNRVIPMRPTETPSRTNTALKPSTNRPAWASTGREPMPVSATAAAPDGSVDGVVAAAPARIAMYTGTRASTHGVRNETTPAANASARLSSMGSHRLDDDGLGDDPQRQDGVADHEDRRAEARPGSGAVPGLGARADGPAQRRRCARRRSPPPTDTR